MRPPADESAVAALRSQLPEFEDHYLDLLDIYDEDLTPEIVLMELAEYVGGLLGEPEAEEILERSLEVVEALAIGEDGAELVGYAFLNVLPDIARDLLEERLGDMTGRLAREFWHGEILGSLDDPAASAGDRPEAEEGSDDSGRGEPGAPAR